MYFNNIILKSIPSEEFLLLAEIQGIFNEISSMMKKSQSKDVKTLQLIPLNCHLLTRFLVRYVSGLRVVDGFYYMGGPKVEQLGESEVTICAHSWLLSDSSKTIIDVYPVDVVCIGGAIALPTEIHGDYHGTPYHGAMKYKEGVIDNDLFDPVETILNMLKFEAVLKKMAMYS